MLSLAEQAQSIVQTYLATVPVQAHNSHLADPDALAILFNAVSRGLNDADSCHCAGISQESLKRWNIIGTEQPESAHGLFVRTLKNARSSGKLRRLEKIEKAGEDPRYWAANAWINERTDPEQFALRKEDSQVPQVIVHAEGARTVTIGVVSPSTFAPVSPLEDSANLLTGHAFAFDSSPITAIMVPNPEPCQPVEMRPIAAVESQGDPAPAAGRVGGQPIVPAVKGVRPARKQKRVATRRKAHA